MQKDFYFWKNPRHCDLGYKPDVTKTLEGATMEELYKKAEDYCDEIGPDCVFCD